MHTRDKAMAQPVIRADVSLNLVIHTAGDSFHFTANPHESRAGACPRPATWSGVYTHTGKGLTGTDASGDSAGYI